MTPHTAQTRSSRRATSWALAVVTLGAFALMAGAAGLVLRTRANRSTAPAPSTAPSTLRVIISGDTHGWITPCGCTANQSGGLLRRATYLQGLRRGAPVIYLDAGGAPAGTSAYQRAKFEAILSGETRMDVATHNIGGGEAALGADYLREVEKKTGVPFVSANVRDSSGNPVASTMRIVEATGRRIGVTGVLSPRFAAAGVRVDDPRASALAAIREHRGQYDALLVLAYLPEGELEQFAAGLPEADAVVGGPTGQAIAPRPSGSGLLAAATNKGKFLVQLTVSGAAAWSGTVVEVGASIADEPGQVENLNRYLTKLAELDIPAAETGLVAPLPPGSPADYRVAGNAACVDCHKEGAGIWEHSKHAHAFGTLRAKNFHVDPSCLQCHTTGYGMPGGFDTVRKSGDALGGVGCESCHGPSQAHAKEPKVKTPFAARDQCARCHDPENSPSFAYDAYWQRIRHGTDIRAARGGFAPSPSPGTPGEGWGGGLLSRHCKNHPDPRPFPDYPAREWAFQSLSGVLPASMLAMVLAPSTESSPASQPTAVEWLTDLNKGLRDARDNGRPVLVYAGADWCEPCRELHKQLVRPEVRAKLAGWTLVYLDVDKEPQPPAALGIGPIPALRLLTPAGRVVGSQDGFIPAEELVHWLDENRTRATSKVDADLAAVQVPDEASVVRLVAVLGDADPALREAAIRRLAPHPAAAAGAAVQRFLKGDLASRLAALELLQEWQAPTDGLDPWRRETLTPQRLGALERWAASKAAAGPGAAATRPAATKPTALSVERMNEARGELDRLLLAGDDEEARAGIERLARIGPALLPEVYDRLKGATNDARRERLTTLRYRLVASGALAVTWPAGLRRLASPDPATRHAAAEELVKRATPQDAPLLVELFSDPDPLVREISLRGMRAVGSGLESGAGPDDTTASTAPVTTPGALAKLLNDPIPNVRAAVLKELSSSEPDADAVALVVKYVKDEKDVDLLVHAVRVLREARRAGAAARQCLIDLLGHESWRVRAEAAEALGKQLENQQFSRSKSNGPVEQALLKLLQDEDGFVASRAVLALQRSSLEETADAMAKAAEKHPELTGDIVAAFRGGGRGTESKKITQHLRRFCAHADPAVRAAAVEGLATLAGGGGAAKELGAALKDPAARVRIAGARAVVAALDGLRPDSAEDREEVGSAAVTVFGIRWGSSPATRKRLAAAWLEKFRAGEGRPEWFNQLIEPLRACMAGTDPAERVWAAAALVAVGQDDAALPVMREAARQHPEVRVAAASSLPWLPPDKRLALFDELLATGVGQGELGQLVSYLAKLPEPRVTDRLWQLVAAPGADVETADDVLDGLRTAYFAGQHYNASQLPAAKLAKIAEAAKPKALKGPELQRVVALVLLANSSDEEAAAAAAVVRADPSASPALRRDALQVLLACLPKQQAEATAVGVLSGGAAATAPSTAPATAPAVSTDERKLALKHLARGEEGFQQLRERMYLYRARESSTVISTDGKPQVPAAPQSLKPEMLRDLLAPSPAAGVDEETAAYAGYLACLLGRPEGMQPLAKYWREKARDDEQWKQLLARAAAALGDDALTPLLQEVYSAYGKESYSVREFYWTIRSIKGPNILKLRKQIRDEVGMDRLR